MNCFEVKLQCKEPIELKVDGEGHTLSLETGKRCKAIIGDDGVSFFIKKEKCYSLPFDISDMANYFAILKSI